MPLHQSQSHRGWFLKQSWIDLACIQVSNTHHRAIDYMQRYFPILSHIQISKHLMGLDHVVCLNFSPRRIDLWIYLEFFGLLCRSRREWCWRRTGKLCRRRCISWGLTWLEWSWLLGSLCCQRSLERRGFWLLIEGWQESIRLCFRIRMVK